MAFQMPDMTSYLNAMMQYWGPLMDASVQRAQELPARESAAFEHYIRGKRLDEEQQREDILRAQQERKWAREDRRRERVKAPPMRSTSTAASPSSRIGGSGLSRTMQTKATLDAMPRISTGGITGTEAWRNLPAAAAMTGLMLPTPHSWR